MGNSAGGQLLSKATVLQIIKAHGGRERKASVTRAAYGIALY
jgi:hypothetical protein